MKDFAIEWSDRLGIPKLFGCDSSRGLTILLFHEFRFNDESWNSAREKLKRKLDFLATYFEAVTIDETIDYVRSGGQYDRPPLLVTLDDAKRDILETIDLFRSFEIPLLQFVCAGWSSRASISNEPRDIKARLVSWLHFYEGPPLKISFTERNFVLNHNGNQQLIDAVILSDDINSLTVLDEYEQHFSAEAGKSFVCDWAELRDLKSAGVQLGCHSISHPKIALQSAIRKRFEIEGAHKTLQHHLGPCRYFAYPYGTADSYDADTYNIVDEAGFEAAFTTNPRLTCPGVDRLLVPRIAIPDRDMRQSVFKARARGGSVPFSVIKGFMQ